MINVDLQQLIQALDAETLSSFHRRILGAGDVVVAAAGRLDHDALVRRIADGDLHDEAVERRDEIGEDRVLDEHARARHAHRQGALPARRHHA